MDTYELLRMKARERRDRIIKAARADYRRALKQIDKLLRALDDPADQCHRKVPTLQFKSADESNALRHFTAIAAAEAVLNECGPMTLVELAVELQMRGCRTQDTPRQITRSLRESFRYHADRFRCDADKRWSVVG